MGAMVHEPERTDIEKTMNSTHFLGKGNIHPERVRSSLEKSVLSLIITLDYFTSVRLNHERNQGVAHNCIPSRGHHC